MTNAFTLEGDKVSEFNLNLVTLDSEQLGIPETEYSSIVTLPSGEFSRLCKELSAISETGIGGKNAFLDVFDYILRFYIGQLDLNDYCSCFVPSNRR